MNEDNILDYCDEIDALTQKIRDEVDGAEPEPEPEFQPIHAGDDLQAALDQGGAWLIDAGANFQVSSGYKVSQTDTVLRGSDGNVITGGTSPAITVPVSVSTVTIEDLTLAATSDKMGVLLGTNGSSQNTVELAPSDIELNRLTMVGFRGKRSIEVNATNVSIEGADIRDTFDPGGQDSQAICILNAPGPVSIVDSYLEAASETVMVGGDSMKIPNCRPTGITIARCTLTKPLAWKEAGTPKVKNLLELKDGNDVLIDDCDMFNSWASAQDGYCYTLTPSNGGSNLNVVIRNNRVHNVGGIANIVGLDKSNLNPNRSQITFTGGDYRTNKAEMGGRGIFALVGRGPEWLILENLSANIDGSSFIDVYDPGMGLLKIVGSTWNYGSYGVRLKGYSHGDNVMGAVETIIIEGNTITGAHSQFKTRYPNNTYVDSISHDREIEVDNLAAEHAKEFGKMIKKMRDW